jgi:hypothetical protein
MEIINKKYYKTVNIFLIPIISIILFVLFYIFLSSEIFGGIAAFFNSIVNNKKKGMFPWIAEIPLIFFFSAFLFFCLSLFLYNKIKIKKFAAALKVNSILFAFLVLYSLLLVFQS